MINYKFADIKPTDNIFMFFSKIVTKLKGEISRELKNTPLSYPQFYK